jgi:hypothetical protein
MVSITIAVTKHFHEMYEIMTVLRKCLLLLMKKEQRKSNNNTITKLSIPMQFVSNWKC